MPALKAHGYQKDCVCPSCAEYRADRNLAVIQDFIDWANGDWLDRIRRAVNNRLTPQGIDVPLPVWKAAGCRVPPGQSLLPVVRLGAHA
jgi:hypothetical protein